MGAHRNHLIFNPGMMTRLGGLVKEVVRKLEGGTQSLRGGTVKRRPYVHLGLQKRCHLGCNFKLSP